MLEALGITIVISQKSTYSLKRLKDSRVKTYNKWDRFRAEITPIFWALEFQTTERIFSARTAKVSSTFCLQESSQGHNLKSLLSKSGKKILYPIYYMHVCFSFQLISAKLNFLLDSGLECNLRVGGNYLLKWTELIYYNYIMWKEFLWLKEIWSPDQKEACVNFKYSMMHWIITPCLRKKYNSIIHIWSVSMRLIERGFWSQSHSSWAKTFSLFTMESIYPPCFSILDSFA